MAENPKRSAEVVQILTDAGIPKPDVCWHADDSREYKLDTFEQAIAICRALDTKFEYTFNSYQSNEWQHYSVFVLYERP